MMSIGYEPNPDLPVVKEHNGLERVIEVIGFYLMRERVVLQVFSKDRLRRLLSQRTLRLSDVREASSASEV